MQSTISERKVAMKSTRTGMSSTRNSKRLDNDNDIDEYDYDDDDVDSKNNKKNRQVVQLFIQQTLNYRIQQYFVTLIVLVTICTIAIGYFYIFTTRRKQWNYTMSIDHTSSINNVNMETINFTSFIHEIDNEYLFHNTIKSCNPNRIENNNNKHSSSCGEYIPTLIIHNENNSNITRNTIDSTIAPSNKKIQRIALLTPPGIISTIIQQWMIQIIQNSNKDNVNNSNNNNNNDSKEQIPEIQFIHRTNVPPLGYGKTHGLTKIVRIIVRPILYQVYDTLYNISTATTPPTTTTTTTTNISTSTIISLDIIQSTVRQILRYHCRLSQISAHTSIHTIVFTDIINNPILVYQQLYQFISNTGSTNKQQQSTTSSSNTQLIQQQQQKQQLQLQLTSVTDTIVPLLDNYKRMLKYQSTSILLNLQQQEHEKELDQHQTITKLEHTVESMLHNIIQNELQSTKNYTAWPCPSFWKVGGSTTDSSSSSSISNVVISNSLLKQIALSLVPICNEEIDPYASCGVHYDQCEATGHINC